MNSVESMSAMRRRQCHILTRMKIGALFVYQTFQQALMRHNRGQELSPAQVRTMLSRARRDEAMFEVFKQAMQTECPTWAPMAIEWARSEMTILAFDPTKFSLRLTACPTRDLWAHLLGLAYEQPDLINPANMLSPSITVKDSMPDYLVSTISLQLPDYSPVK